MKKTVKILNFAAILLIFAVSFTCKKEEIAQNIEFEIYENHEISACNVDDPLVHIDWLKKFCADHNKSKFTIEIYLYSNNNVLSNNDRNVNTILIVTKPFMYNFQEAQGISTYPYNQFALNDCLGNIIMSGETSIYSDSDKYFPDTPDWNQFFAENNIVGLIWAINKK
jgi:hypothetical protein